MTMTLFGFNALPDVRKPFAPVNHPPMRNAAKRENMPKPLEMKTRVERADGTVELLPGRTIEKQDGARMLCKPSRGYVEGAISPKRGHAMGGATSPGNWTAMASGERQDGSAEYLVAERRAYAKAHVKGPQRERRVLNADLNAEPTTEFRSPGGNGQVSR
jgi:hypothetical protein